MSPLAHITSALVRFYQVVISPLTGPCCRFDPTCSHYAIEAIRRHGALAGCWLALRRIVRCGPWGGHGADPVPDTFRWHGRGKNARTAHTHAHDTCGCAPAGEAEIADSRQTPSRTSR